MQKTKNNIRISIRSEVLNRNSQLQFHTNEASPRVLIEFVIATC